MAGSFSQTTQWDLATTGNDSNGGGFDTSSTGTDYSQQDAAQVTYTDLVIGATNTQATSAAFPFGAAHVGNIINITGGTGFTVQRVQVVSVAGTMATFDKALGTAGSTGGSGKLGGRLGTIGGAVAAINANAPNQGNVLHIKNGTYTTAASLSPALQTLSMIGYGSAHYDYGAQPLITTATNSTILFTLTSSIGSEYYFSNIVFSNTAATRAAGFNAMQNGIGIAFSDCVLDGFTRGINGDYAVNWNFKDIGVFNTEIKNCSNWGIYNLQNGGNIWIDDGSWIHDNGAGGGGGVFAEQFLTARRSIISANTGPGIRGASTTPLTSLRLMNCDIANNTGDGVDLATGGFNLNSTAPGGLPSIQVSGCVIYGNGGYGLHFPAGFVPNGASYLKKNAYGSNTSGNLGGAPSLGFSVGDFTLTANPFTSATNFALNSAAGGGALLKGAGLPGNFAGGSSLGSNDIGAVQSAGGGGATGMLVNSGMTGGVR